MTDGTLSGWSSSADGRPANHRTNCPPAACRSVLLTARASPALAEAAASCFDRRRWYGPTADAEDPLGQDVLVCWPRRLRRARAR